ncbi:MAG: hypothetical protein KTR29_19255 [Rhodothermaceae bacterium]|nr:hypothetical protein [Rhodothermaceae bacterium]
MDASTRAFIDLLDQINREAGFAILHGGDELRLCIEEYNDIYDRLSREKTEIAYRFSRLATDVSAGSLRMTVRDMIHFLEYE